MGIEIENLLVIVHTSVSLVIFPCFITLVMRIPLPLFPRAFLFRF